MKVRQLLGIVLAFVLLGQFAVYADGLKALAPVYSHWVEAEVSYIISTNERKEFLKLRTDAERDGFIQEFWRIRNPDQRSEINSYKEEHYRRLAYVNRTFGVEKYDEGWRTDMGRMYITLGPPQQRAPYHLTANIREMEIWFYQGSTPALPPYFYLLFFKKGSGEDYRLYSPRQDGPAALTSTGQQDTKTALKIIKNALGNEVARTSLSLYPTEPVNFDDPQPSFESDLLLSSIRNLPDSPLERQRIALNRSREHVTASIFSGQSSPELVSVVFRDEQGRDTVNYLLRGMGANAKVVGELPTKESGYKMTLRSVVTTADGKPVFVQQELLTGVLKQDQVQAAQQKALAVESRLPLVPGSYEVEATLTNNLTLYAVRLRERVVVPERRSGVLGISKLLVYTSPSPVRDTRSELPFSLARLRFTPKGADSVTVHQGDKLPLVFQVWLPKGTTGALKTVHLHFLYGTVAASKPLIESDEDVETSNADADGNLMTGHTLDTVDVPVGAYRLVVGVSGDAGSASAYSTLTVHVVGSETKLDQWTAYGATESLQMANDDLKRGLASEALGRVAEAERWYALSLKENPAGAQTLTRLVGVMTAEHESVKMAELSSQPLLQEGIDLKTVLSVANAMQKVGQLKEASAMLAKQITVQAPSAELYRAQARLLAANGDARGAAELLDRASRVAP